MAQRFKKWLSIKENLKATVISPQDRQHQIQQNGGRETLRGLPKENRPPHLLYSHSDPVVGKAQKDIKNLQQQALNVVDTVSQSKTVTDPGFRTVEGKSG